MGITLGGAAGSSSEGKANVKESGKV